VMKCLIVSNMNVLQHHEWRINTNLFVLQDLQCVSFCRVLDLSCSHCPLCSGSLMFSLSSLINSVCRFQLFLMLVFTCSWWEFPAFIGELQWEELQWWWIAVGGALIMMNYSGRSFNDDELQWEELHWWCGCCGEELIWQNPSYINYRILFVCSWTSECKFSQI